MAAGSAAGQGDEGQLTLAESWNGASWKLLNTPNPASTAELLGVSCVSVSNCMAVGDFQGLGDQATLAETWNGTHWAIVKTPHP